MELAHNIIEQIVNIAILFFECIGVTVLIISGIRGTKNLFKKNPNTKLFLAKGMSISLEFKLGSEILRTVIVREWSEIALVAGIIALRAALAFLIHWEIQCEENRAELADARCRPSEERAPAKRTRRRRSRRPIKVRVRKDSSRCIHTVEERVKDIPRRGAAELGSLIPIYPVREEGTREPSPSSLPGEHPTEASRGIVRA